MSYYSILPSQRARPPGSVTTTPPSGQNPDPMKPLQTPDGGFRTRDVNPDELSGNQMNSLLDEKGRYIQRARSRAGAASNAAGLGFSSLAMGAAEGAAIDAAMPMAQQQAGAYTNVGDRNMSAENDYLNQRAALNNALQISQNQQGTSLSIAQMNQDENRRQFDLGQAENTRRYDQGFATDAQRYDTDWTRQQERDATQNTNARNNFIASSIINTTMSDPSIWRDGPGALGFANYYGQGFNDMWDNIFSPTPTP